MIVRPQAPESQIMVGPQILENQIIVRPQTPENQIIVRPQTPENQIVLYQTPESQMITPIEPPSRARMRLTRKEEEPPADVSLRGKRHKLRQNEDYNASEHMDGEYTQNQYSNTEDRISFKLRQPDGNLILIRSNCTRTEAKDIARKFVAVRINLFNQSGSGLIVGNCFDAVLLDPDRCVYLRQPPDLRGYEIELSDTSVQFRSPIGEVHTIEEIDEEL
ncbi:hypothetical protein B0J14DRAFT_606660 [Halenospora varia]|nr:hypothetical protein B0J14DRAFT_606660 [Halenospora varia]